MPVLAEQLRHFQPEDLVVRVVSGLLGVLPGGQPWQHPGSLLEMARRLNIELAPQIAARAEQYVLQDGPYAALQVMDLLDSADKSIAMYSGLKAGVQSVRGKEDALETDPQQAADAGLKAIGIAYVAWRLMPGQGVQQKAEALLQSPTGQALLRIYVAADVILPFADNLASGGLDLMSRVIDQYAGENIGKLRAIAPDASEALGLLARLSGSMKDQAQQLASSAKPLMDWCREKLPGILGKVDALSGIAATALDALSIYRYLGAVLVAEVCVQQAWKEIQKEVEEGKFLPPPDVFQLPAPAEVASASYPLPTSAHGIHFPLGIALTFILLVSGALLVFGLLLFGPSNGTRAPATQPAQPAQPPKVAETRL